ncbi:hypothetical protein ABZY58_25945 [Micromonospora tulbaghiae]|uniref:hypothetical protein n=1 Tax=Micromonospora tulbaghiae TaxID=479978 RepID=UPI0033A28A3A
MTRFAAGGGPSDYTIVAGDTVTIGPMTGKAVVAVGGIEVKWWNAETGGTVYEDLLNSVGQPVASVPSSDTTDGRALGQIPRVFYPDNVTGAWASAGGGPRVWMPADVGDQAVETAVALAAHQAQENGHGTGLADLVDTTVPPPDARTPGHLLGVVEGGAFALLPPSVAAGAVMLNPPTSGGNYVGNTAQPPDPAQGQSGNPWLKLTQPYSATDDNPDALQFFATSATGQSIKTGWFNGNGEVRSAPSLPNRVGARFFEAYENRNGPSTGRFFELSTNPLNAANREALLGAYGTGHSSKPGWVEATRVLSALLGVRAGGNYNGLTAVTFRGQRSGVGPPTTGTWAAGDLVLDSAVTLWLCTTAGTPGTWTSNGPSAYVDITPGTNMAHGAKRAASRLERGGDAGRLRGTLTASGAVSSGAVLATIPTTVHRPKAAATTIARYSGGGAQLQVATNGEITLGAALSSGQSVWLDSITWDLET